ncbi:hypothetical protein GN156_01135 [bacterium LRH843]|nr:hypothetical protein [bacterium LRH843]
MIHMKVQQNEAMAMNKPRPIVLSTGQVFQGRITKLYPNNLATLSFNGMNVTARLEAALTAGGRYWFEVQEGTGIPRLRLLHDNGVKVDRISAGDGLLQLLDLPKSKGMELLGQRLVEQQIPFSREAALTGAQMLENLNQLNEKGIRAVISMIQRQLPLTEESFLAYKTMLEEPSLHKQLQQLLPQLAKSHHPTAHQLTTLISNLLNVSISKHDSPIPHLLLLYSSHEETDAIGFGAKELLTRLGLLSERGTKEEIYSEFQRAALHSNNQEKNAKLWPRINSQQWSELAELKEKALFETLLTKVNISADKEGTLKLQQLLQLIQGNDKPLNVEERWRNLSNQALTVAEKQVLQQTIEATTTIQSTKGGAHLQSILHMLGIGHEHDVIRFLQGEMTKEALLDQRLKALLLQFQQQELPEAVKEQVARTLLHITGQQMIAEEQKGPLHQFIMHLPLSFGTFQTDVTMQWEGKKKANGELDPDFCRIIFYLTLGRMEETVVDVQIQNRVVALSVFNDQEKPQHLIDLLFPSLKRSLEERNYQLLSVKWERTLELTKPKPFPNAYKQTVSYKGVDVRI